MRKLAFLAYLLIAAFSLLMLCLQNNETKAAAKTPPPIEAPATGIERVQVELGRKTAATNPSPGDPPMMLSVLDANSGETFQMDLESYVAHAVAAEMPASFELEALKAQAVAARSYTAWKSFAYGGSGCQASDHADICTDSAHCMAYASDAELKRKWGEDYESNWQKVLAAVNETKGLVCAFQGEPIQALFHSISGGKTEDSGAVYAVALPYLSSVESAGEEEASQFHSSKTFTKKTLAKTLNNAFPGAALSAEGLEKSIELLSRTSSGRIDKIRVGKKNVTGRQLRSALGLNSTNFTIEYTKDQAVFHVTGYGHGVGMSQVGANAMAKQGKDYQNILLHYYQGVTVESLGSLA